MLQKYINLSYIEKYEIIRIMLFMWTVRIRLWTTSYKKTKEWCNQQGTHTKVSSLGQERLLRLVNGASKFVLHSTCLTKALTAHTILKQYSVENMLLVGVKQDKDSDFEAHAWIQDLDSNIIFGGDFSNSFKPIMIEK